MSKHFVPHLFVDLVGQHIKSLLYVACNSDSEILAVLKTVETVVRTQIHRLGPVT